MLTILGHLYVDAVISHRIARKLKPSDNGELFLTYKYNRPYQLPGTLIRMRRGICLQEDDRSLLKGLYNSSHVA